MNEIAEKYAIEVEEKYISEKFPGEEHNVDINRGYASVVFNNTVKFLDWLSENYCIVPKKVFDGDYIQLADDYAKYLDPDDKTNQEIISLDSLGFLNWILEGGYTISKQYS